MLRVAVLAGKRVHAAVQPTITPTTSLRSSHLELKFITSLWTKSADQILASVKRFCRKTQQTLCGEL
jgi:hypothetical protein